MIAKHCTIPIAYGFMNIDNLLDMIMLRCSEISAHTYG
jgi:hypothetical protein